MGSGQFAKLHQESSTLPLHLVIESCQDLVFTSLCCPQVSLLFLPGCLSQPVAAGNVPSSPTPPTLELFFFLFIIHSSRGQAVVLSRGRGLLRRLVRSKAEGEVHPDLRVGGIPRQSLRRAARHRGAQERGNKHKLALKLRSVGSSLFSFLHFYFQCDICNFRPRSMNDKYILHCMKKNGIYLLSNCSYNDIFGQQSHLQLSCPM